jgi:16S rRNA G966 N2-methylase RsmD
MYNVLVFDMQKEEDRDLHPYYEDPTKAYIAIGNIFDILRNISKYPADFYKDALRDANDVSQYLVTFDDPPFKMCELTEENKRLLNSAVDIIRDKILEMVEDSIDLELC